MAWEVWKAVHSWHMLKPCVQAAQYSAMCTTQLAYAGKEWLDKRPAFKHAIVALFFWSRNGWYEQLVVVGNVPASLSPVKSTTHPKGLALVTTGEKCRLSEWLGLSGYSRDLKGVARSWKLRILLIRPPVYHLCWAHTKAAPSVLPMPVAPFLVLNKYSSITALSALSHVLPTNPRPENIWPWVMFSFSPTVLCSIRLQSTSNSNFS